MKTFRKLLALLLILACLTGSAAAATRTDLTMRLSTRTGPSTSYTEPGTFFGSSWQNTSVSVLSKAYGNGVWWVQVEFTHSGKLYRAYTGAKRVAMDVSYVPEEQEIGYATANFRGSTTGWYGPGRNYATHSASVPSSASGAIIASENGWLLFDFYDSSAQKQRRVWLESSMLNVTWYNGNPGGHTPPAAQPPASSTVYYCTTDVFSWVEVISRQSAGGYTTINLHLNNQGDYPYLGVHMETNDYGTFTFSNGHGDIWFVGNDKIIIDPYYSISNPGEILEFVKLPR